MAGQTTAGSGPIWEFLRGPAAPIEIPLLNPFSVTQIKGLRFAQDDKLSKQSFEQKREIFSTGLLVSEIAKLGHDFAAG